MKACALFASRLKHKPQIQLKAAFIGRCNGEVLADLRLIWFFCKVEVAIKAERGGQCRRWAGNYDGGAVQRDIAG